MATVHYFLGSRHSGSRDLDQGSDRLNSLAWFCEGCGDVWARVAIDDATWSTEFNRCERCGPAGSWDNRAAGSLLRQWYFRSGDLMGRNQAMALENLPPALLEREFHLALKWADRQQSK